MVSYNLNKSGVTKQDQIFLALEYYCIVYIEKMDVGGETANGEAG